MTYSSPYAPSSTAQSSNMLVSSPSPTTPNPSAGATISGNWIITAVNGISYLKSNYSLNINSTTMSILGGCSNYYFSYTLTASSIGFSQPIPSVQNGCSSSNDNVYVSAILSVKSYTFGTSTKVLILLNNNGNIVFALNLNTSSSPSTPSFTSPVRPPTTVAAPLQSGNYRMINLQRPDLPLITATIANSALTFNLCNTYSQPYSITLLSSNTYTLNLNGSPTKSTQKVPSKIYKHAYSRIFVYLNWYYIICESIHRLPVSSWEFPSVHVSDWTRRASDSSSSWIPSEYGGITKEDSNYTIKSSYW